MHITQSLKAAAAALATFALAASAAGTFVVDQARADGDNASTEQKSSQVVSQLSYYGDYEGFTTVDEWMDAIEGEKETANEQLKNVLVKMNRRDDVEWGSCRDEIAEIRADLAHAISLAMMKDIQEKVSKLDTLADTMIAERDAQIEAERIAAEEAAAAEAAAAARRAAGPTPQSGVYYFGGQRETYYSSNVLYHYRTPEWTLDDQGFYREGDYYVVAANTGQYSNGDTFECSKGTAIVRDSGCAYGTTDFYVAW